MVLLVHCCVPDGEDILFIKLIFCAQFNEKPIYVIRGLLSEEPVCLVMRVKQVDSFMLELQSETCGQLYVRVAYWVARSWTGKRMNRDCGSPLSVGEAVDI